MFQSGLDGEFLAWRGLAQLNEGDENSADEPLFDRAFNNKIGSDNTFFAQSNSGTIGKHLARIIHCRHKSMTECQK